MTFRPFSASTFDIAEGEVVAIIGSNGAGKSTLMRSISGLITNGASQISYRGEQIGALRADQIAEKGIALVPEGRQLFPSLSVEEKLADRGPDRTLRSLVAGQNIRTIPRFCRKGGIRRPLLFRAGNSRWLPSGAH